MERFWISQKATGYRWFPLWLVLGVSLAVVLLVNSVWNYVSISNRIVVDQVRKDLWLHAAGIERTMQRGGFRDARMVDALLEQVRLASKGHIVRIELRSVSGGVIARSGVDLLQSFTTEFIVSHIQNRQPIFKILQTRAGTVVLEAMPARLPDTGQALWLAAANQSVAGVPHQMVIIEIAALLDGAGATFWPLRRSLLINSSAAVVLLLTLAMIGLRFGSYIEGRHLEHELEIARRVQQDLLPAARQTRSDYFDAAADCVPAKGVGGDFYDVFSTAGGGSAFVLGDVSGKGVPAALLAGVVHGAVRSTSWTDGADLHEAATSRINQLLCERASRERYATMFWSYFDPQGKILRYINAGHFPPLLVREGRAIHLSEGGPVLGMLPGAAYLQGCVRIEPGDILVIYSDGIIETTGPRDEPFGEKRLLDAVEFCSHQDAQSIRNQILTSVELFARFDEPEDDRTLLIIRYTAAAAGVDRCGLSAEQPAGMALV